MGMRRFSLILLALGLVLASAVEDFDDFGNSSNTITTAPPTHTTSHAPATTHSSRTTNGTAPPTTHGSVTTQNGTSSGPTTHPATPAATTQNGTSNGTTTPHVNPATPSPGPMTTSVKVFDSDNGDQVCFRMNTNITVMIGNGTATPRDREAFLSNRTFVGNVSGKSFCSLKKTKAQIFLTDEQRAPGVVLGIILNATNTNKKQTWNIAALQFQVDDSHLQKVGDNINRTYQVDGKKAFPYSQDVGFERFFQCQHSFYVNFTNLANGSSPKDVYPSYFFDNVKLQAFQFKNGGEEFVNGVTCQAESSQGNKIVPIAVGAALAGLVVVVLIAYVIGRCRSRRHSYESLS